MTTTTNTTNNATINGTIAIKGTPVDTIDTYVSIIKAYFEGNGVTLKLQKDERTTGGTWLGLWSGTEDKNVPSQRFSVWTTARKNGKMWINVDIGNLSPIAVVWGDTYRTALRTVAKREEVTLADNVTATYKGVKPSVGELRLQFRGDAPLATLMQFFNSQLALTDTETVESVSTEVA